VPVFADDVKTLRVKGKIVKLGARDGFLIRIDDTRDMTLHVNDRTRYVVNQEAAKFTDLKVGSEVNAVYVVDGDRAVVQKVFVGPVLEKEVADEGTVVEGRVVRVIGEDRVVILTPEKKEVTVYVVPKTTYSFNDKEGRFVDLKPNADVRIVYDVRDRRPTARAIRGLPVRPRR
jgi:hypothetical protein